jgi:hypothetical protein
MGVEAFEKRNTNRYQPTRLGPSPAVSKELQELLLLARVRVVTLVEIWDQRISWAYGNAVLSNPTITRAMVEAEAEKIYGPRPEEK